MKPRGFSRDEAEKFYDVFGARQDRQKYYEDVALADLVEHADFGVARNAVEFGCGTGRFAEELLAHCLPQAATYWGCDISNTMIQLGQQRLSQFGEHAIIWKSSYDFALPLADASVDRFVSNYVLDILSADEIHAVMNEAKRVLKKDGLLCLTGLTYGKGLFSKIWTAFWMLRYSLNPKWVGGCRPVALLEFLDGWDVVHHNVVIARWISSEVVVVRKTQS